MKMISKLMGKNREEDSGKDRDDRDNDEKLDERKALLI